MARVIVVGLKKSMGVGLVLVEGDVDMVITEFDGPVRVMDFW